MGALRTRGRGIDWAEGVHLLPSGGVLVVWTVLMASAGGFDPRAWLPAGVALTALLVVAVAGSGRLLPTSQAARIVLVSFAAFVAFNVLSIAWAKSRGDAYEASQLLVVTLLSTWILALAPWRPRSADALVGFFSIAVAAVCIGTLFTVMGEDVLTGRFTDFRFNAPLGYPNTTAAFALIGAIPALVMAARPDLPLAVKALGQGVATLLIAYALLPQSRGSVLGILFAVVVLLAVTPFRWRLTVHALLAAIVVYATAGPVLDVYTVASRTGRPSSAIGDATVAILVAGFGGILLGVACAWSERQVRLTERGRRSARVAGVAALAVVVLAAAATAAAEHGRISNAFDEQWQALKHPGGKFAGTTADDGSGRFDFIDPLERYDYWRVSVEGFRASPIGGMGAGGFNYRYALDRRYAKTSKYPHNLAMSVLGDNGIVGLLLLLTTLAAAAWGLLRRSTALGQAERGVIAAAVGVAAYFLGHGMFDWLEAYPVLTAPALGFLLVALATRERAERIAAIATPDAPSPAPAVARPGQARRRPALPAVGWIAVALPAVVIAASLLASYASERYRTRAVDTWRVRPAAAYADLDRAADLDPFSPMPDTLKGLIAVTRGDLATGRAAFRDSLAREPFWLPHFVLGAVAAQEGDRASAEREWSTATRLNRLDPVMPALIAKARKAKRVDAADLVRQVLTSPLFTEDRLT